MTRVVRLVIWREAVRPTGNKQRFSAGKVPARGQGNQAGPDRVSKSLHFSHLQEISSFRVPAGKSHETLLSTPYIGLRQPKQAGTESVLD